jgi:type VI secretion system secreted protein Hcp
MGLRAILLAVVLIMCSTVTAFAAPEFAVQVTGQIQGPFKGESTRKGFENKFVGLSFDQEIVSPRDAATGQATMKRVHKPIKIKKAWGPASLQFIAALTKNESLTVVVEFFTTDPKGMPFLDHSVKLTNASVASFKSNSDVAVQGPQTDTIELVYQGIEIRDHLGKGSVSDSLNAP